MAEFENRKYTFTIDTSKDNQNWTQQFEGDSDSGGDSGLETYNFTDIDARFVRINVIGNDKTNFATIIEAAIFGSTTPIGEPLPPIPTPNPSPQFKYNWFRHGFHVNYSTSGTCGPEQDV